MPVQLRCTDCIKQTNCQFISVQFSSVYFVRSAAHARLDSANQRSSTFHSTRGLCCRQDKNETAAWNLPPEIRHSTSRTVFYATLKLTRRYIIHFDFTTVSFEVFKCVLLLFLFYLCLLLYIFFIMDVYNYGAPVLLMRGALASSGVVG